MLPGEDDQRVVELRDRAAHQPGVTLLVPPVFWYEVANALWVAVHRQRIPSGIALETEAPQLRAEAPLRTRPRRSLSKRLRALAPFAVVHTPAHVRFLLYGGPAHRAWLVHRILAEPCPVPSRAAVQIALGVPASLLCHLMKYGFHRPEHGAQFLIG